MRKRLRGTDERPRLSVFRSEKHIYAQVISDETGETLLADLDADAGGARTSCKKTTDDRGRQGRRRARSANPASTRASQRSSSIATASSTTDAFAPSPKARAKRV